ncbi:adenosylcobinamide-GDP ribazoletransferase [Leptospira sp. GIMC2001]|uniref:adenosylcobinamide-GDP ribazoletransferase n=1 Tax=Leptospira sp. GIMC2001 TaxID=1513297 RepID=UPI00234B047F|nr:adenosylcobinamide-GDP ribazoletransferase [Leptospira sp. GIMC2001]WCL51153.1 adenosylcobinamide-GDP ribazoletransferase [Leptospira sp. GIMC2001]
MNSKNIDNLEDDNWLPKNFFAREYGRFAACLMFLTRIPALPHRYHPNLLRTCHHYSPLVGLIVGGILASLYYFSFTFFGNLLVVWFALGAGILITGSFHEDGFADTCDGLGGSFNVERKLEIMKDSRLGTYGTMGLIFLMGFKFLLLSSLDRSNGWIAILVAHVLARTVIIPLNYTLPYVGNRNLDKPMALDVSLPKALFSSAIGWIIVSMFLGYSPVIWFLLFSFFILLLFCAHFYLKSQIRGYTGDTLGAVNQVMEILVYFAFFIDIYFKSNGSPF